MLYKVTKQYGRGTEVIANSFSDLVKARNFMHAEAKNDANMKIQATYRLYEFDEVMEEVDTTKLDSTPHHKQSEQQAGGAAGAGRQTGFRPTPLGTSPKPKGSVHLQKDDKEDKE